jgi:hypothetical protein
MSKLKVGDVIRITSNDTNVLVKIKSMDNYYADIECIKCINRQKHTWKLGMISKYPVEALEEYEFLYNDLSKKVERCLNIK